MRGKKVLAVMLCAAMVSSNMGMISMAGVNDTGELLVAMSQKEELSETDQKLNHLKSMGRVATSSEPEKPETPSEPEKPETPTEPDEPATPSEATYYVSTEDELREAVEKNGKIVLENEISLTKPLTISKNVETSLNGGEITFAGDKDDCKWLCMIEVSNGSEVTFQNITIDATGLDRNEKNTNGNWKDYYAIFGEKGTKITIKEGTYIISDNEEEPKNFWKRGMWIDGTCSMEGGTVSGFVDVGIVVGGNFIMTGGIITQNGRGTESWEGTGGLAIGGKRSNKEEGYACVEGGSIIENETGVFNNGHFEMNGGEISENKFGLINNNRDAMTNEEFSPVAVLGNGEIVGNHNYAIWNRYRGIVTIQGNMEISGQFRSDKRLRSMAARTTMSKQSMMVIRNGEESTLTIDGGTVSAYASNEIAIFNDSTSMLKMNGGEIVAAGENSVAIQNANMKRGDVTIEGGTLTTTGTGSKLFDNQGHIDLNVAEVILGGDASGKYIILASHNEGGNVAISSETAVKDETIQIKTTPDDGYRISDVKVDNVSKGAAASLEFTVTGNHKIEVTFEKKQSSGSGSSGGSSSGSSRTSVASSTKTIPETPGSWIQDQTGWKFITGAVPYKNTWIRKNNAWYWVGEDEYMKTGWNLISEKWYYLMPVSGEMKTGWIADGGNWYYTDETGARLTGWVKIGDKWYYLNADGKMAVNVTTPDGYKVDENGVMIG